MTQEEYFEMFRKQMGEVEKKLLQPSLYYLQKLRVQRDYSIISIFPSINGVRANLRYEEKKFIYETEELVLCPNFYELRLANYGFKHEFTLRNEDITIEVPQLSSRVHTQMLGQGMATKGRVTRFKSDFSSDERYCRCVLTRKFNPLKCFAEIITTKPFNADNKSLNASGLLDVQVGENRVQIVEFYRENEYFLFVDSKVPIIFELFEPIVNSILLSFGFLSGFIQRDALTCLQSTQSDFSNISGCLFKELESTVDTGLALVDPRTVGELYKSEHEKATRIKPIIFSNLVTKAIQEEGLFRAMKIIAEANNFPSEIRASAYSVALETIRNLIIEDNKEKVAPIKNHAVAKELKRKFKELVDGLDETEFSNREALYKRINDFNQLPNKDSFKAAFELVGLVLTEEDLKCIESRNAFLHGRMPIEQLENAESEIKYFTQKLHFLASALILKYCGYTGWMLNSHKYLELFDSNYTKRVDEPTFRKI